MVLKSWQKHGYERSRAAGNRLGAVISYARAHSPVRTSGRIHRRPQNEGDCFLPNLAGVRSRHFSISRTRLAVPLDLPRVSGRGIDARMFTRPRCLPRKFSRRVSPAGHWLERVSAARQPLFQATSQPRRQAFADLSHRSFSSVSRFDTYSRNQARGQKNGFSVQHSGA